MRRTELDELAYIVPIATVPSILQRGILSHRHAHGLQHASIALDGVQNRREAKIVPNGRPVHEYANLYICPRNPMLLRRSNMHDQICVLRVSTEVLDLPNVVITDGNAGSKYVRFLPAPAGLAMVDRERTFARWWAHPGDEIEKWRHSVQKCAEVLVPDLVPVRYIIGAYASCELGQQQLRMLAPNLPIEIDADLFFQ
ncbi:MAG TPA: DUF4433 domain-containing protein [Silvibacterium sp.]|nr:DUF4433 domain-containing protein [Silvibacterium sp.]